MNSGVFRSNVLILKKSQILQPAFIKLLSVIFANVKASKYKTDTRGDALFKVWPLSTNPDPRYFSAARASVEYSFRTTELIQTLLWRNGELEARQWTRDRTFEEIT